MDIETIQSLKRVEEDIALRQVILWGNNEGSGGELSHPNHTHTHKHIEAMVVSDTNDAWQPQCPLVVTQQSHLVSTTQRGLWRSGVSSAEGEGERRVVG